MKLKDFKEEYYNYPYEVSTGVNYEGEEFFTIKFLYDWDNEITGHSFNNALQKAKNGLLKIIKARYFSGLKYTAIKKYALNDPNVNCIQILKSEILGLTLHKEILNDVLRKLIRILRYKYNILYSEIEEITQLPYEKVCYPEPTDTTFIEGERKTAIEKLGLYFFDNDLTVD